jgi:hypothetical protein
MNIYLFIDFNNDVAISKHLYHPGLFRLKQAMEILNYHLKKILRMVV